MEQNYGDVKLHIPSLKMPDAPEPNGQATPEQVGSVWSQEMSTPVDTAGVDTVVAVPDLVYLSDVEAKAICWLWRPYLPLGMLSLLDGDPGAGKSFVALAIAAGLSRGKTPEGETCEPITTLYLTNENPIEEVMVPRFQSLGGDPSKLVVLRGGIAGEERFGITMQDVGLLEQALQKTGAKLVVLDPLQSYLGGDVDMHRANMTRPLLDGLIRLAEKHGCAILLLRHFNKTAGAKALYRGLGTIDLTAAVRSEMLVGFPPDHPENRAFLHIKSNVAQLGPGRGYRIGGEDGDHPKFEWTGATMLRECDLMAMPEPPEKGKKLDTAKDWLREQLKDGERGQKEIQEAAEATGFSWMTIRRASDALNVGSRKRGIAGGWWWSLPPEDGRSSEEE